MHKEKNSVLNYAMICCMMFTADFSLLQAVLYSWLLNVVTSLSAVAMRAFNAINQILLYRQKRTCKEEDTLLKRKMIAVLVADERIQNGS